MADSLPPYPTLRILDQDLSTVSDWIDGFRILMRACSIANPVRQRAMLLHYLGPEARRELATISDTGADDDIEALIHAITTRFVPKANKTFERHCFRTARQLTSETVDRYQARLLYLARNCAFPEPDAEICSHIITTCSSEALRLRALRDDLALPELLMLARSMENADAQSAAISHAPTSADLHRYSLQDVSPIITKYKPRPPVYSRPSKPTWG
jgi:hypothetical protein